MNRLTKFEKNPNSKFPYKLKDESLCTELDSIHKLGLIEDLMEKYRIKDVEMLEKIIIRHDEYSNNEESFGCPFDVVFKALFNGIYESYIDYGDNNSIKIRHREVRGIGRDGLNVINPLCGYPECDDWFEYKDYKKTWFLKKDKSE